MALFLLYLSIYGYFKRHLCEIMLYRTLNYVIHVNVQNSDFLQFVIYCFVYIYIYIYIY